MSMSRTFEPREYGTNVGREIVALVAGFGGKLASLDSAALELVATGREVVTYEYSPDVLLSGNPADLSNLIHDMHQDFDWRAMLYDERRRYAGLSLGAGIAWNMQRRSMGKTQPGLYGAFCHDVVDLVLDNKAFLHMVSKSLGGENVGDRFRKKGYDHASLSAAWAGLLAPHNGAFALVLGKNDRVIPYETTLQRIQAWQAEGLPVAVETRPTGAHSATMKWYLSHMPKMLELADSLS
jgi:hypothetical protein